MPLAARQAWISGQLWTLISPSHLVSVMLNLGNKNFIITRGMRIAQMVISTVALCYPVEVSDLDITARGADGFGSTGV